MCNNFQCDILHICVLCICFTAYERWCLSFVLNGLCFHFLLLLMYRTSVDEASPISPNILYIMSILAFYFILFWVEERFGN